MHETQSTDEFQTLVDAALPTLVREAATSEEGKLYRSVMARVERPLLRQALELSGGNQLKAARLLGINRNTLRKRLRLLGLLRGPGENGSARQEHGRAATA
jgi:two-component system nitrogen regulation response regulator GlnG